MNLLEECLLGMGQEKIEAVKAPYRPIWLIAADYNRESVKQNGHVTVVRRRVAKKKPTTFIY